MNLIQSLGRMLAMFIDDEEHIERRAIKQAKQENQRQLVQPAEEPDHDLELVDLELDEFID